MKFTPFADKKLQTNQDQTQESALPAEETQEAPHQSRTEAALKLHCGFGGPDEFCQAISHHRKQEQKQMRMAEAEGSQGMS